jgi:hypothetical protein
MSNESETSDAGRWKILEGLILQDTAALEASLEAFLATPEGAEWLQRVHPDSKPEGFLEGVKADAGPFLADLARSKPLNTGAVPPENAEQIGGDILDACTEEEEEKEEDDE